MIERITGWWRLRSLIRCWSEFRDSVALSGGGSGITDRQEKAFLHLKAKIASLMPVLVSAVPGSMAVESKKHFGQMTDLLNRYPSLRRDGPGQRESDDFEKSWHHHFIFLNTLRGVIFRRASHAPSTTAAEVPTGMRAVPTGMPRHSIHRPPVRIPSIVIGSIGFLVRLAVLVLILYIMGRTFGVHWTHGHLSMSLPTGYAGLGHNFSAAINSLLGDATGFLHPVVTAYGPYWTIGLVGVVLLALGYLMFIRR